MICICVLIYVFCINTAIVLVIIALLFDFILVLSSVRVRSELCVFFNFSSVTLNWTRFVQFCAGIVHLIMSNVLLDK